MLKTVFCDILDREQALPAFLEYFFWGEVANDIRIYGTDFEVHVYFISGEQDNTCAISYVKQYYEDITAPDGRFEEFCVDEIDGALGVSPRG